MNERRQGMVSRVKIAEKERDSLEGAKLEAEQYLSLEREKLEQESIFYQIICRHAEVGGVNIPPSHCASPPLSHAGVSAADRQRF